MIEPKLLGTHIFDFTKGERLPLTLKTLAYDNGDSAHGLPQGIYFNQELTLQADCNSAKFELFGAIITPKILRDLANQLDEFISKLPSQ